MRTIAVALAVALVTAGSSAAAFVVTSKNIKDGTIQPVDLSAKTKRVMRGNAGPAGPAGQQGPRGFTGERGPQGERGPAGFQNVTRVTGGAIYVNPNSWAEGSATCYSGTLVGGGYESIYSRTISVYLNAPTGSTWEVGVYELGTSATTVYPYALCASS